MKKIHIASLAAFAAWLFLSPGFAYADSVATSVTVGNGAPTFTAGPAESTASTEAAPSNVGTQITFQATGDDPNGETYYLIVCKTNSFTENDSGAPTCAADQTICVSSATADGVQATCNYTPVAGDSEKTAWYARVCDSNTSDQACSATSQGSGDSGSPLEVNHYPTFSASSNNSPQNPGGTITWTSTASDPDSEAATPDTVKLVVCKTEGISGGTCDGGASDRWCESSLGASNPTCGYEVPTPSAAGANNAYVYVVDNHNFYGGAYDATNVSFTISNVAPVTSLVSTNGGSAMTLTGEQSTTSFDITATVTDNNGCSDISSSSAVLYRSSVSGGAACSGNNNNCYTSITCTVDVGSCTGSADANATYTCTASVQYHADPTVANTEYADDTWISSVTATDGASATHTAAATGVELNMFEALSITATLGYGSMSAGSTDDPLEDTTTVTSTGNVGLDVLLQGDDMCTDYDTCAGDTIDVGQQKYATTGAAYGDATALALTDAELETNFAKTTTTGSPTTGSIYWGISIPANQPAGAYTGQNDVTAKYSEFAEW